MICTDCGKRKLQEDLDAFEVCWECEGKLRAARFRARGNRVREGLRHDTATVGSSQAIGGDLI